MKFHPICLANGVRFRKCPDINIRIQDLESEFYRRKNVWKIGII